MTKNLAKATVARRVDLAIREAGVDAASVARAADITTTEMEDRLNARVDFQIDELVRVGGFLRVPVTRFVEVAA